MTELVANVKSGFWGNNYSPVRTSTPMKRRLQKLMRKNGLRVEGELLKELTGASVGETASVTQTRVAGNGTVAGVTNPTLGDLGGKRTIETVSKINRVTTSADETDLDSIVTGGSSAPTYPGDLSGNGK